MLDAVAVEHSAGANATLSPCSSSAVADELDLRLKRLIECGLELDVAEARAPMLRGERPVAA